MAQVGATDNAIESTKKSEKLFFDIIKSTPLSLNDKWYIISSKWFNRWDGYINESAEFNHPGPMDNSDILEETSGKILKKDLSRNSYKYLPKEIWTKLLSIYGIIPPQHPLKRTVKVFQNNIGAFLICLYDDGCGYDVVSNEHHLWENALPLWQEYKNNTKDSAQNSSSSLSPVVDSSETISDINLDLYNEHDIKIPPPPYNVENSSVSAPTIHGNNNVEASENSNDVEDPNLSSKTRGLVGLMNLGNTCYMNSGIQCLSNTWELTKYFLDEFKEKDLNKNNVFGTKGQLPISYAEVLSKIWKNEAKTSYHCPSDLKFTFSGFASSFLGYGQHDCQEFIGKFLDLLHEDLNRVLVKSKTLNFDEKNSDKEIAEIAWKNHLSLNDSIIVDIFHGQYISTLKCQECQKVSVTFDPFSYICVPIPEKNKSTLNLKYIPFDMNKPVLTLSFPVTAQNRCHEIQTLISQKINVAPTHIIIANIYKNHVSQVYKSYEEIYSSLSSNQLCIYEVLDDLNNLGDEIKYLFVYNKKASEKMDIKSSEFFLIPILIRIEKPYSLCDIYFSVFEKLKVLFKPNYEQSLNLPSKSDFDISNFPFRCSFSNDDESNPVVNENINFDVIDNWAKLYVIWGEIFESNINHLNFDNYSLNKEPIDIEKDITLIDCIESYLAEELLTETNSWYCPNCRKNQLVQKKIDFWRLPQVIIFQLKRFVYNTAFRSKIETKVIYPLTDLNMTQYLKLPTNNKVIYDLYAVSNHMGGLFSGHYTADAKNPIDGKWYNFNDSFVTLNEPYNITRHAYLLFYRRRD